MLQRSSIVSPEEELQDFYAQLREHVNTGDCPAFLFSFTDAPVMKALDLYREEGKG
jgi:gentisate 1,2-dioxygenase